MQLVCWPFDGGPTSPPGHDCNAEEQASLAAASRMGYTVAKVEVLTGGWPCRVPFEVVDECPGYTLTPDAYVFLAGSDRVAAVKLEQAPDGSFTGEVVAIQGPPAYPTPPAGYARHWLGGVQTFVTPASWQLAMAPYPGGHGPYPFLYLSSDPIVGPCPSDSVYTGDLCYRAPDRLSPNAILIKLESGSPFPAFLQEPTAPTIHGQWFRCSIGDAGSATWVPHVLAYATACFKGPDLQAGLAAFTTFANSWSWMPPPWSDIVADCMPRHGGVDATCPPGSPQP